MADITTISCPREWAAYCRKQAAQGKSIGFVPTMGALHQGHASLMQQSLQENDLTMLSIFVNPAQFNDAGDLDKYPRTLEDDLKIASDLGVNAVFLPNAENMYPDGYEYRLTETNRSAIMEGESRPGHYDGVLTVVMKLLLLTGANRAYFGEKDYQQYVLIQRMADAFFLADTIKTQIIMCPIIREADGLAMSSRNVRLSAAGRQQAARFPQILRSASNAHAAEEQLRQAGFRVDYVTDTDALAPTTQPAPTTQAAPTTQRRRFAAVFVEDVRLIDTMALSEVKHES